jgi:hypothetical protein
MKMRSLNLQIRQHRVRFVLDRDGYAGCFYPIMLVFLKGPNGSPAGVGPKPWPWPLKGGCRPLRVRLPHLSWATCYRLGRVGGFRLYRLQYRAFTWACGGW